MKNIGSNNAKDVTKPIYGCPQIRSKYTADHTKQILDSLHLQPCNYYKNNNKQQQPGHGKWGGGGMHGGTTEENVLSYTQIRTGNGKYLEKEKSIPP